MRTILTTALVATMLAPATLVATEAAFSWSGTYRGFFVCDDVTDARASGFGRELEVLIVQEDDTIRLAASAVIAEADGSSTGLYRGLVRTSPLGDTVSGYLEVCRGSFDYKELIYIAPASTGGETFGFSADTVFVSTALPGAEGALVVESCKWALTRTSANVPEVPPCPQE